MATQNTITRRAAIVGAAASVAAVSTIPANATKAMRLGRNTATQMKMLIDDFVASAKAIDPSIEGVWAHFDMDVVDEENEPMLVGFGFDRKASPFIRKPGQINNVVVADLQHGDRA